RSPRTATPAPGRCGGAAHRPEPPPPARTGGRSGSHPDRTTWHRQTDPAKGYARSPPRSDLVFRIADLVRLTTGTTKRAAAHRTSTLVWSIGLAIDGL